MLTAVNESGHLTAPEELLQELAAHAIRVAAESEAAAVLADAYELVRARDESIDLRGGPHDAGVGSPGTGDA